MGAGGLGPPQKRAYVSGSSASCGLCARLARVGWSCGPASAVPFKCLGTTRQSFGQSGVPLSKSQLAVRLLCPDHSLGLLDTIKARLVELFEMLDRVGQGSAAGQMLHEQPLVPVPILVIDHVEQNPTPN